MARITAQLDRFFAELQHLATSCKAVAYAEKERTIAHVAIRYGLRYTLSELTYWQQA